MTRTSFLIASETLLEEPSLLIEIQLIFLLFFLKHYSPVLSIGARLIWRKTLPHLLLRGLSIFQVHEIEEGEVNLEKKAGRTFMEVGFLLADFLCHSRSDSALVIFWTMRIWS